MSVISNELVINVKCVQAGIQAYFGALAVVIIIGAVIPGFHNMTNTLPVSAGITTQDLIGLIVYTVIYLPILWFVPPHQIRKCLYPSFIMITATFIGIVAWIVHENGGTGSFVSSPIVLSKSQRAFRMVQCISSVSGTWGGAAERISDWTRFEKKRGAANPGMMFALPVSVTLVALIGVVIATATTEKYGTAIWNPLVLLTLVQTTTYTPLCRAATFFAGCGLLSSQIFINMSQNTIPYGMDVAALFPRYLSMKRAAVIVTLMSVAVNPWRFLGQAYIFITVLSCVTGKFLQPSLVLLNPS
jgi:NCS1 family nucleobase:cation symporter-1